MEIKLTDWDLIKLQYEVLHESKQAICAEHGIAEGLLDHAISTNSWTVKEQDTSTEFLESVERQASYISTQRQQITAPLYTKLEYVLLLKCLKVLNNISSDDSKAATNLKAIATIIDTLLKHNDILAPNKQDIAELTMQFLNKMRSESDDMLDQRIQDLENKLSENGLQ